MITAGIFVFWQVNIKIIITFGGDKPNSILQKIIPLLRIFDLAKARDFYIHWLGFQPDWKYQFTHNFPTYWQISKENLGLHLTEHHGDCCSGAEVFIVCNDLRTYHAGLLAQQYRFNSPGLEIAPWNALTMDVIDPFGNHLLFSESMKPSAEPMV